MLMFDLERNKELRIHLDRRPVGGRFKVRARIVLAKREAKLRPGVLHSLEHMVRYSFEGDVPSVTRTINNFKPKTLKGKAVKLTAKAVNFAVHDVGRTAVDVGLAGETLALNAAGLAGEGVKTAAKKLSEKYKRESSDDAGKAVLAGIALAYDARKGIIERRKKQYKAADAFTEYKLHSKEYTGFLKNYKPNLQKAKLKLKQKKTKFNKAEKSYHQAEKRLKQKIVSLQKKEKNVLSAKKRRKLNAKIKDNKTKLRIRTALYKDKKTKYHTEKRRINLSIENLKSQKRSLTYDRSVSMLEYLHEKPAPVVMQVGSYGLKRLKASAQQKILYADERNDTVKVTEHLAEGANKAAHRLYQKINPMEHLRDNDKKIRKLEKKSSKLERKSEAAEIKSKNSKSQKRKNRNNKKAAAIEMKNAQINKTISKLKAARSPAVIFSAFCSSAMIMILVAMIIMMLFGGFLQAIFGNSGWMMGTYTAQDKYLSQAEEYYLKLAWEMNKNILLAGSSDDWKKGLEHFGSDSSLDDEVDTWYWGQSEYYDYAPVYDFDPFKLWSFLCAYYYNFSEDTDTDSDGDIESDVEYWTYDSNTEAVLDDLFESEYQFEYYYDNTSHWVDLDSYNYWGGGNASSGEYYEAEKEAYIYNDEPYKYRFKPITITSELSKYEDSDGYICIADDYRVLDPNDGYKETGFYIMDHRHYSGSKEPFYYHNSSTDTFFFEHGDTQYYRTFWGWDDVDAWFLVSPTDTHIWNESITDCCLYGYYEKCYWKTDCRLYYNVKQLITFDDLIKDRLTSMDNGEERYSLYCTFLGTAEDSKTTRGNHQEFTSPLSESMESLIANNAILNGYGHDMQGWNTQHCGIAKEDSIHEGIDIICDFNTPIYAGLNGKIEEINEDKDYVVIREEGHNFWYDGDGNGKKRDVEIYYYNILPSSGLNEGDEIKKGDKIGICADTKSCEDTASEVSDHYIHMKVYIDTDGYGWDFIDPRLVFE